MFLLLYILQKEILLRYSFAPCGRNDIRVLIQIRDSYEHIIEHNRYLIKREIRVEIAFEILSDNLVSFVVRSPLPAINRSLLTSARYL